MCGGFQLFEAHFSALTLHNGCQGCFLICSMEGQVLCDLWVKVTGRNVHQSRKAAGVVQRMEDVSKNRADVLVHCKIKQNMT